MELPRGARIGSRAIKTAMSEAVAGRAITRPKAIISSMQAGLAGARRS
jgi:hypothetical protein